MARRSPSPTRPERLGLKHNSAVELVDRSEREGLLDAHRRSHRPRRAILRVTRKGRRVLDRSRERSRARAERDRRPAWCDALEHVGRSAIDAGRGGPR